MALRRAIVVLMHTRSHKGMPEYVCFAWMQANYKAGIVRRLENADATSEDLEAEADSDCMLDWTLHD